MGSNLFFITHNNVIYMGSSTLCLSREGESAMPYFVLVVIDFSDNYEAVEK